MLPLRLPSRAIFSRLLSCHLPVARYDISPTSPSGILSCRTFVLQTDEGFCQTATWHFPVDVAAYSSVCHLNMGAARVSEGKRSIATLRLAYLGFAKLQSCQTDHKVCAHHIHPHRCCILGSLRLWQMIIVINLWTPPMPPSQGIPYFVSYQKKLSILRAHLQTPR